MKRKQDLQTTLIVILVIALIVAFARIDSLESDIKLLRRELSDNVTNLETKVDSIYENVDTFLKQEASLLSGVEYQYGALEPDTQRALIQLSVVPKQLREDTRLLVSYLDTRVELTRKENVFEGAIPVSLFAQEEQLLLTIVTAEGEQTEYLQQVHIAELFPLYVPRFHRNALSGKTTYHPSGKYEIDGTIDLAFTNADKNADARFVRFALITERNGEEIENEDITEAVLNSGTYPYGAYTREDYQKTYDVQQGDELVLFLEAEDSMGYIHRCMIHFWKQQNYATAEARYSGERIYDLEGNLLYGNTYG